MLKWPGPEARVRVSTYWLAVSGVFVVAATTFADPERKILDTIKDWQTLIAGVFAIIAAYITLLGPREQIRQADRLAAEAADREQFAARSMLPIGLNYITEYARTCMSLTEHEWRITRRQGNPIKLPEFDRANLVIIRDCIRYAPEPYRARMVALLSAIQILEANALGNIRISPAHSLMIMCTNVTYLCDTLFDYARGNPDSFPIDAPMRAPTSFIRKTVFFRPHHDDSFWPDLEDDLKRRDESDAN